MQLLRVAALAMGLAASSTAAPTPQPNYWWNVTQWDAGCGSKACPYSFHVAALLDGIYPGFKANCAGTDTGSFEPCTITGGETTRGVPSVSSKLRREADPQHPNGVAFMSLSLEFTDVDNGNTYNYTGHHTADFNSGAAEGRKFKVYPTKATVVG